MGWRSDLLQHLPARVSMPLRARLGFSREAEMKALPAFVRPGDNCLDIGCHLGIYAYQLLHLVGPGGSVVGFEPQDHLANYLEAALAHDLRSGRFEVRRAALGAAGGEAVLTLPLEAGKVNRGRATLLDMHGNAISMSVPVLTLDTAGLRRPVSFIKCDVEGYELAVLQGASALLAADTPTLLVEIEAQHAADRVQPTFELLWSLGYDAAVYRQAGGALARIRSGDSDPATAAKNWVGKYVYNYFFVPKSRSGPLYAAPTITS